MKPLNLFVLIIFLISNRFCKSNNLSKDKSLRKFKEPMSFWKKVTIWDNFTDTDVLAKYTKNDFLSEQKSFKLYSLNVTEVVNQFHKVELVLKKMNSIFSKENRVSKVEYDWKRKKRSILTKIPKCTVSKEALKELNKATNRALSNVTMTANSITCELISTTSDNCEELLKQIQCGILNLKNAYTKINTTSTIEITKLTNAYDDLFKIYMNSIDAAEMSASQKHKLELDKLKEEIQELNKLLHIKLDQLKELLEKICVSEIQSGKITNAIEHFKQLNDDSKLSKIIQISYTEYGKQNNVENILKFIRQLPFLSQDIIAYNSLYAQMQQNNILYSYEGFLFKLAVLRSINYSVFNELSEEKKNSLHCLRNMLTLNTEQSKIDNHKILEYTRFVNHYNILCSSLSINECWKMCENDKTCKSITFLHANRYPHYRLNCCYLYRDNHPQRSEDDKYHFTSIIYKTKCACPCKYGFHNSLSGTDTFLKNCIDSNYDLKDSTFDCYIDKPEC